MNIRPWVARLKELSPYAQEIILKFLEGLDQTGGVPTVKQLEKGVREAQQREREKNETRVG